MKLVKVISKITVVFRPKDGVYKLDGLINPATKRSIGAAVQVYCTFDNNGKGKWYFSTADPLYFNHRLDGDTKTKQRNRKFQSKMG